MPDDSPTSELNPAIGSPAGNRQGRKLTPIVGIFLTVFLDLLSFGMFIPDLQLRIRSLAANHFGLPTDSHDSRIGLMIGASLGIFSLCQLLTAPYLGRLSDRIGRRKILMFTTALSVLSYIVYAHASSLSIIFLARAIGGVGAGNLGVAFAYIADVTKPEDRAKGLGMVGAAFGLGFILGPFSGSQLLHWGRNDPLLLGYVAAGLSFINFLYVWRFLPESLKEGKVAKGHFFSDLRNAVSVPGLGLMLLMFFSMNLGFTNLETTYFQLLADGRSVFHLGSETAKISGGYILAFVGVIAAFTQGLLVKRLSSVYGEVKVLRISYLVLAPTLALIPFAPLWIPAMIGIIFMGVSYGLAQPNLSSLISRTASRDVQGGIFGITQALGALARTVGPLVANGIFTFHPSFPYLLGGALVLIPAIGAWSLRQPKGFPLDEAASLG